MATFIPALSDVFVKLGSLIQRKYMREEWRQVQCGAPEGFHESAHMLIASGTQRCDGFLIANAHRFPAF